MSQVLHPYFRLIGKFDPDEITRLLEIQPTWVTRIGDPGPPDAIGPMRGAEWCWQPEDDDSDHVGDQLAYMAGELLSKQERVADLSKKFSGTFHIYNQDYGTQRNWLLSAQLLRLIADLHVDIQCENIKFTQDEESRNDAH
jgi:hypothetical protein